MEEGCGMVGNGANGSFFKPLKVRLLSHGVPPLDSTICAELLKCTRHELPTLVIMQHLDPVPSSKLHVRFEGLECLESVCLVPEKIHTPVPCCIINKDAEVPVSLWRLHRHGTMEISMDETDRLLLTSC